MYINGHNNKVDVIQNVIENIDDGLLSNAKDMLNQLKDIEMKSTVYKGQVYDSKTRKFISFDEFKAQQEQDKKMSEDEKNLYKIVDKLEQRITTQEHNHTFLESRVDGLDKDIDAITKVLAKMKLELYYTPEEDEAIKKESIRLKEQEAEILRKNVIFFENMKKEQEAEQAREIMKNVTNKEDK